MKFGLKTKIITKNPFLFTAKDRTLSTPELLNRLDYVSTKIKEDDKDNKIAIRFFREYLEAEGQICVEIPHFDHLKTAINNDNLVMANLSGGYIYKDLPSWSFHYVVVNGFDFSSYGKKGSESHEVCYLDPSPKSPSPFPDKISRLAADEFLYAVNSVCHGCVDCGCLIEISRK